MSDTKYCSQCAKWRPADGFTKTITGHGKTRRIKHRCAACTAIAKSSPAVREAKAAEDAEARRAKAAFVQSLRNQK